MHQTKTATFTSASGLAFSRPDATNSGEESAPTLLCPYCDADTHRTFHLDGTSATIECPNQHRFHDPEVHPHTVRQAQHLVFVGQDAYLPIGHVQVLTVPALDDDRTLATRPAKPRMWTKQEPGPEWQVAHAVDQGWPAVTRAFQLARRVMSVALPHAGDLWADLHPSVGGDPVDAHMTTVLLALWIYETYPRYSHDRTPLEELAFPDIGDGIIPWHSNDQLRHARPAVVIGNRQVSALRATDVARLENADRKAVISWGRWAYHALQTANNVINAHRDSLSKIPSTGAARLMDLTSVAHPATWPDEQTWYHDFTPQVTRSPAAARHRTSRSRTPARYGYSLCQYAAGCG
ncbi:hypothetical protein ACIRPT_21160 [Streptomyces sp. NPDC101227]|uniref:hypothetical protein n=1 Tax=Streptomyces sp. NPDC101227 TaxID=3366136 RepID=UPI0038003054